MATTPSTNYHLAPLLVMVTGTSSPKSNQTPPVQVVSLLSGQEETIGVTAVSGTQTGLCHRISTLALGQIAH